MHDEIGTDIVPHQARSFVGASGGGRVKKPTKPKGASASARAAGNLTDAETCWLCSCAFSEGFPPSQWKRHLVHAHCTSALRCHQRLMLHGSELGRVNDNKLALEDPDRWKTRVQQLYPPETGGNRDAGVMKSYQRQAEEGF